MVPGVLLSSDNTAVVLTRRGSFQRQNQPLHFLPVVISDGGSPSLSSTNTLTITICKCDLQGNHLRCNQSVIQDGLGTAAVATLTCILTLLGMKTRFCQSLKSKVELVCWTMYSRGGASLDQFGSSGTELRVTPNVFSFANVFLSPQV